MEQILQGLSELTLAFKNLASRVQSMDERLDKLEMVTKEDQIPNVETNPALHAINIRLQCLEDDETTKQIISHLDGLRVFAEELKRQMISLEGRSRSKSPREREETQTSDLPNIE